MKTDTLLISLAMILLVLAAGVTSQGSNQEIFLWFNANAGVLPDAFWANMTFVADTLFAVAVIQIKPQLERLLGLPGDSLTKEIALTERLARDIDGGSKAAVIVAFFQHVP